MPLSIGLLVLPWMGLAIQDEVRWSAFQSLVSPPPYGLVILRVVQQNPYGLYSLLVSLPGLLMLGASTVAVLDYLREVLGARGSMK